MLKVEVKFEEVKFKPRSVARSPFARNVDVDVDLNTRRGREIFIDCGFEKVGRRILWVNWERGRDVTRIDGWYGVVELRLHWGLIRTSESLFLQE